MYIMLLVAKSAPKMTMANRPSPKSAAKTKEPKPAACFSTPIPTTPANAVPMARYAPARVARTAKRARDSSRSVSFFFTATAAASLRDIQYLTGSRNVKAPDIVLRVRTRETPGLLAGSTGGRSLSQRESVAAYLNGKPSSRRSLRPSSSLVAEVTTVMSIPRGRSTLSMSIS